RTQMSSATSSRSRPLTISSCAGWGLFPSHHRPCKTHIQFQRGVDRARPHVLRPRIVAGPPQNPIDEFETELYLRSTPDESKKCDARPTIACGTLIDPCPLTGASNAIVS